MPLAKLSLGEGLSRVSLPILIVAVSTVIVVTKWKNLLVPFISKPKQEKIAELVKQSFVLCKKAKQLLDEATKKVEAQLYKNFAINEFLRYTISRNYA